MLNLASFSDMYRVSANDLLKSVVCRLLLNIVNLTDFTDYAFNGKPFARFVHIRGW